MAHEIGGGEMAMRFVVDLTVETQADSTRSQRALCR
jgi:hypothetical protein